MKFDTCYLVFPRSSMVWKLSGLAPSSNIEKRIPLLLLPALFAGGREVLIFGSGRVLTKKEFLTLKRTASAWIECSDPKRVILALRLPTGDSGVQRPPKRRHG
ncbi:MAG: hypothetical protein QM758_13375 [Armatimonas sp.]